MVNIRKKKIIDGMDREILRKINGSKKSISGRQIALKVKLSPSAIKPRLLNLKRQGIIKNTNLGIRTFSRKIGNRSIKINSPRSILWDIDLVKRKKFKKK